MARGRGLPGVPPGTMMSQRRERVLSAGGSKQRPGATAKVLGLGREKQTLLRFLCLPPPPKPSDGQAAAWSCWVPCLFAPIRLASADQKVPLNEARKKSTTGDCQPRYHTWDIHAEPPAPKCLPKTLPSYLLIIASWNRLVS
jgi:hypothetical protein